MKLSFAHQPAALLAMTVELALEEFFESAAADHVGRRSGGSLRRAAAQVRQALDFDKDLGLGHVVHLATGGFDQMAHLFENDATLLILTGTHDGLPVGGTNIISF